MRDCNLLDSSAPFFKAPFTQYDWVTDVQGYQQHKFDFDTIFHPQALKWGGQTVTSNSCSIELLKSILEQWDSDSGRPLINFFCNNTQTLVTLLQSTSSQEYQNKTKQNMLINYSLTERCEIVYTGLLTPTPPPFSLQY